MIKVLFVCVHNSARSQMAEAFLNRLGGKNFIAESAGLEPGTLNPDIVEVMREVGYDISQNQTKSVFDFYRSGNRYRYVIKVCDQMNGQRCPIFPATLKVLDWNHEDPAAFQGSREERLAQARKTRDDIKANVEAFIEKHVLTDFTYTSSTQFVDKTTSVELSKSLRTIDLLTITEGTSPSSHGAKQTWFEDNWHQQAGSAPTVATNLMVYRFGRQMLENLETKNLSKLQVLGLMEEIWSYVTPDIHGMAKIDDFSQGLSEYIKHKGLNIQTIHRHVERDVSQRAPIHHMVSWIEKSLNNDSPLAFLRPNSNPVENNERWHWLTVVGLEESVEDSRITLVVLDNGQLVRFDFKQWYETDTLGGGFVSLD